jgi:type I protein arginine methyltransferase
VSLIVDEHREYLSDGVRLSAFARALAHHVTPQSIVADLGTGTGILALLACRAGARRVYAIEASGMVEIARAVAAANGVSDRLRVIKANVADVTLPERVDVIVGDFIGRFGFDAGIFETYPPAARALLRPAGAIVPSEISLSIFPVESPGMDERVRFWQTPRLGIDVAPVSEWALNTGYTVALGAVAQLGDAVEIARAPTALVPERGFAADARLTIRRPGILHGIGGAFTAQLAPGVTMTNAPGAAERVARRNVFFPVRAPAAVAAGDVARVRMRILPNESIVNWTVEVADPDGVVRMRSGHSTVHGMLIAREDLARERPDFVPSLTPHGAARLTVLESCDGRRPLREVERRVYERHRDLFASPAEAAAFVAGVTAACTRP